MAGVSPPREGIPQPHDDDDDDVAWALQTATVQWKRDAHSDAIAWLRRAVDYALEAGHGPRASQLESAAARLTKDLLGPPPAPPPRRRAPSVSDDDDDDDIIHDDDLLEEADGADEDLDAVEVSFSVPAGPEKSTVPALPSEPPPPSRAVVDSDLPQRDSGDLDIPAAAVIGAGFGERGRQEPQATVDAAETDVVIEPSEPPPALRTTAAMPSPTLEQLAVPPRQSADSLPDLDDLDDEFTNVDALARTRSGDAAGEGVDAASPALDPGLDEPGLDEPGLDDLDGPGVPGLLDAPDLDTPDLDASHDAAGLELAPALAEPDLPDVGGAELGTADLGAAQVAEPALPDLDDQSPAPAPEPARTGPPPPPAILGVRLSEVRGFQDLPDEAQATLASRAKLEVLQPDEALSFFAVALVARGDVSIVPAVSDIPCGYAGKGDVIFTQGNLEEGVALSVAAGPDGAAVAIWQKDALDEAMAECPWVGDELRDVADRYQATAGATMGPLGERLDESLLASLFAKCEVLRFEAEQPLFELAAPVQGMYVLGAGRLLVAGAGELGPGDLVFPTATLSNAPAPARVTAGSGGALVLHIGSHETHELMMMVPPLLEILAMS